METQVRASIELDGAVLRYAEVERYGARHRLLRLGNCDFDFDVAHEVLRADRSEHLRTVAEALTDVFDGSAASLLRVVLHPPDCHAFFAPLPAGLAEAERQQRLHQEAALLTRTRAAGGGTTLHLNAEALYTEPDGEGGTREWFHVLALEEQPHTRLKKLLEVLPHPACRWSLSMYGVARVLSGLARRTEVPPSASSDDGSPGAEAPAVLALGWYVSHVEYTLCQGTRWRFSRHSAPGAPTDSAYFSVALLQRLDMAPAAVDQVFVYGDVTPETLEPLETVFGKAPARLDPMPLVDLEPGNLAGDFETSAYAPCIGAAL